MAECEVCGSHRGCRIVGHGMEANETFTAVLTARRAKASAHLNFER